MLSDQLTTEDRAVSAAHNAYRSAMAPRDGDTPEDCMWTAVFAARDVYEAELKRLRETLGFYARASTYALPVGVSPIWGDQGRRAKTALGEESS